MSASSFGPSVSMRSLPALDRPIHLLDTTMFWAPQSGGVRRYLTEKHAWIARHTDWRHTIATPRPDGLAQLRIPALPLPASGGYRLPLRRGAAARLLAAQRPDVIEAGDPYRLAWSALDAAQRLGIPAVAYCHSNLELLAARAGGRFRAGAARAARRYAARLYGQFDLVLAPSQAMRSHLVDWGVAGARCQPLGVDTEQFRPRPGDSDWRQRLGLPPDARLLVYAGRLAPEKNLDVLAAAVQRLGAPYWLVAAGAGPTPPRGERVRIVPHLASTAALAELLAAADAFVHAGAEETFGLAVLEALACGTPVVARLAEGLAELVDDAVGVGVVGGTPEAFAEAIAALFQRDLAPCAIAARRRATAFDWNRIMPSLCRHYQRLVGHHAAVPPSIGGGSWSGRLA